MIEHLWGSQTKYYFIIYKVVQSSSFSWQNEDNSVCSVMVLTNQKSRIEEAVVMKWNNKSLVAWASEAIGFSMQSLDYDDSMTNSDSKFDTHSISESDEDLVDVEDLEEGEIRHNVSPVALEKVGGQSPAKAVTGDMSGDANESPAVNEQARVGEGAPALQKASRG
ncbi:hypothetical protein Hanom_Chr15g01351441 [Helianthus anomalus]